MNTWNNFLESLTVFETHLETSLKQLNIFDTSQALSIDHACIRFSNSDEVDTFVQSIADHATEISRTAVNGRDIMIYKLYRPLQIGDWLVPCLEIPYPKHRSPYQTGWEHVEFVIPCTENTLTGVRTSFFKIFPNLTQQLLNEEYSYSESEPQAADDQMPNPTIGIKVTGVGLKFHANPIQDIVK